MYCLYVYRLCSKHVFDFEKPGMGSILLYMFLEGILFLLLAILIEVTDCREWHVHPNYSRLLTLSSLTSFLYLPPFSPFFLFLLSFFVCLSVSFLSASPLCHPFYSFMLALHYYFLLL